MAILNAGKFDKTQLNYYLKMLLFLLKMSGKVGAARKNSLSSVGIPHLGLEDKF